MTVGTLNGPQAKPKLEGPALEKTATPLWGVPHPLPICCGKETDIPVAGTNVSEWDDLSKTDLEARRAPVLSVDVS